MSDEFQSAQIDTDKWHIQGTGDFYYSNFTGRTTWRYETGNVRVENGRLKIETKYDPDPTDVNQPEAKWSTGAVITKDTFLYGYMEIRARLTAAEVASAFWTTGKSGSGSCFNGSTTCSELDVFEIYGKPIPGRDPDRQRRYWSSIHDWSQQGGPTTWTDTSTYLSFDPTQGFHVYGILWSEDSLIFHVDGTLLRKATRQEVEDGGLNGGVYAVDDPARIWLDNEVFEWMGTPPEDASFSEDYEIDYIRTWQVAAPSILLGDCNLDGVVSFSDIPAFIQLLTSGSFLEEADCDQNGFVDFQDIPVFIEFLSGN
jgi:beta-glucanase (GH16 family)